MRVLSEYFTRGDRLTLEFEVVKITEDESNTVVSLAPVGAPDEEAWLNLPEDQLNELVAGTVKKAKPPAPEPAPFDEAAIDKLIEAKVAERLAAAEPEKEPVPA